MASSVLARASFLAGASKIAPHSDALLAKRSVGSFEFFNGHDDSILAGLEVFTLTRKVIAFFQCKRFVSDEGRGLVTEENYGFSLLGAYSLS